MNFMVTSGVRSQMFGLLTPQPFGRDRTCDGISFDEIDFCQYTAGNAKAGVPLVDSWSWLNF